MLGSHVAAWDTLRNALSELVGVTRARYATVIDESNDLWCSAPTDVFVAEAAERFFEHEIANRKGTPLRRGGRLSIVRPLPAPDDSYFAESFAGIYVLIVGFDGVFDPFFVRRVVREALPRIEALTLALPPPDGPAGGEAAAKGRA